MTLDEILHRLREAFNSQNYELADKMAERLAELIRWQRVASLVRHEGKEGGAA